MQASTGTLDLWLDEGAIHQDEKAEGADLGGRDQEFSLKILSLRCR